MENGEHRIADLRSRTKCFALRIIRMVQALPSNPTASVIGKQVLRSGTSIGAHYREAHRSRSNAEFISKMETGLQELDETAYWIELLIEGGIFASVKLLPLLEETNQLIAVFVACVKTAKQRSK